MLRDARELAGLAAVLAMLVGGLQLLEWGLAAGQADSRARDAAVAPDLVAPGAGVPSAWRVRALDPQSPAGLLR